MAETGSRPVYRITDLHVNDRPRERLAALGLVERTGIGFRLSLSA
jgi:hypothetical protein